MSNEGVETVVDALENTARSRGEEVHDRSVERALVVRCSMAEPALDIGLWPIGDTQDRLTLTTLANQTCKSRDGGVQLDSELRHLATAYELSTVVVVGHTNCAVVTDAYEHVVAPHGNAGQDWEGSLASLVQIVEDAFHDRVVEDSIPFRTAHARIVEYNVVRQCAVLRERLPRSTVVAGYVHDENGAYSAFPDEHYLVSLDGVTDPRTLQGRLPADRPARVASLVH